VNARGTRSEPVTVAESHVETAVVRPGDTLIIRLARSVTAETAADYRAKLEDRLPGVDILVLAADGIAVYRPGQIHPDDLDVESAQPIQRCAFNLDELVENVVAALEKRQKSATYKSVAP
jgi:hypothetical protein